MLRDLAAMTLRNTLAIAAENEIGRRGQQMSLDAELSYNSTNRSLTSVSGRQFMRGLSNTPVRKFSSIQQPNAPQVHSLLPVTEPPMSWYHQCVAHSLVSHAQAIGLKVPEQRVQTVDFAIPFDYFITCSRYIKCIGK